MVKTVLVADDETSIRTLISRVLTRHSYMVESASDGAEAIELLDKTHVDALVLDVMMPRVNGFGVLKHIREHHPQLAGRTIFVTAFPRTATAELGSSCEVLSKPFDLKELLEAVERCLKD